MKIFRHYIKLMEGIDDNDLPEQVIEAFKKLGSDQRDRPEIAMVKAQTIMGGGVCSTLIEHVGDLTHRMSHLVEYNDFGYVYCEQKVKTGLRILENPYGYEREFLQNMKNNAEFRKIPLEEHMTKVNAALSHYSHEHQKLIVYNKAQWMARQAAIHLGTQKWSKSVACLQYLKDHLHSEDHWTQIASKFELNPDGTLKVYTG